MGGKKVRNSWDAGGSGTGSQEITVGVHYKKIESKRRKNTKMEGPRGTKGCRVNVAVSVPG